MSCAASAFGRQILYQSQLGSPSFSFALLLIASFFFFFLFLILLTIRVGGIRDNLQTFNFSSEM